MDTGRGGTEGDFANVYDDAERARAYAELELPGTYWLAYRDLPALLAAHVRGRRALDLGCGAGRSTRFLREQGFDVVGVDVAEPMLARARERDPHGDYRRVPAGDPDALPPGPFDLALAAFTFDNVPGEERKAELLAALRARLAPAGRAVLVVSAPEIYVHEWASFTTRAFPENRRARSGDPVRIVMVDVSDARPVVDVLCTDATYRELFRRAGLEPVAVHRPLGSPDDGRRWVSETTTPPWTIWILAPAPS